MEKVFDGQSGNGNSTAHNILGKTPELFVMLAGDLGGGTITIEVDVDGSGTFLTTGITITTLGQTRHTILGQQVRLALSGSTTPNLDAWIGG